MGDRFTKLYEVKSNQYDEKAKIIVEAGQLLCDTLTNNVFVLLKLKTVRKENVKGVKIALTGYNVEGAAVEEKEYSYLDMIVEINQSFGAKTPVYFDNRLIRSFKVKIIDVVTENGEVVFGVEELKKLPETTLLKDYFGKDEYAKEYNRLVGNRGTCVPMKCGYLWLCSCGKYNSIGDENCYSCGTTFEKELQYLDREFVASSYVERIEKEKRDSDYNCACRLLTCNSVREIKEAIKIFERLNGYEDSAEKLKKCNDLLPELEKKEAAEKVAQDKKRKKNLTIFTLAACALVAVIVTISVICVNADKTNRYQKALNDLENEYI